MFNREYNKKIIPFEIKPKQITTEQMFSSLKFVSAVKNPLQKIKATFKQLIASQRIELTPIIAQRLYHISTPCEGNMESLLQEFKCANQFQLWNISEYGYDEKILDRIMQGRQRNCDGRQIVYNLTYEYFANIPFCEMIKSIELIETFLSLNPKNKVYIHCQENKRRSAIFLACYIFLTGLQTDIVSSILKVNKLLKISMQEREISQYNSGSIYKSQHIVLKNLMNYINNSNFINKNAWNLKKILIANAPKIQAVLRTSSIISQQIKFKVLLQIRSVEGISYKKIFHDEFIQGQSLCLRIPLDETVVLKDDFVLIIKYVYEKKGYSILRVQLNTNFIYDQYCRVQRSDMDLSANNANSKLNDTIFMDLVLKNNLNQLSELSKIHILKDNAENQIQSQQVMKQNPPTDKVQTSKDYKSQDQEDGFGILDEEQEAVHNQKMQREIQEQLARELQKIRKKKTQQEEKIVKSEIVDQKAKQENSLEDDNKKIPQPLEEQQKSMENSSEQLPQQPPTQEWAKPCQQQSSSQTPNDISDNQQRHSQSKNDQQSQSESSGSSESQSEQQQQDLDDYLSKLQKQAENHD